MGARARGMGATRRVLVLVLVLLALAPAGAAPAGAAGAGVTDGPAWNGHTHAAGAPGWYGCPACLPFPYHTSSCLYGYPDYASGRGPLINLGGAALQPGFRGYGVLGSPGYGLGLRPNTWIDLRQTPCATHAFRRLADPAGGPYPPLWDWGWPAHLRP